jgi:hypothetical protein
MRNMLTQVGIHAWVLNPPRHQGGKNLAAVSSFMKGIIPLSCFIKCQLLNKNKFTITLEQCFSKGSVREF